VAESFVAYTPGSGGKLHSFTRTIGANTMDEEVMLLGEPYLPGYTAAVSGVNSASAANSHLLEVMAGSSNIIRVRKIVIVQNAAATGFAPMPIQILRLTTAGTGGTVITPNALAPSDGAPGATAMSLPTAKGTEGVLVWAETMGISSATLFSGRNALYIQQELHFKPFSIAAGTSNGFAIKNLAAPTSSTVDITVVFSESSFA